MAIVATLVALGAGVLVGRAIGDDENGSSDRVAVGGAPTTTSSPPPSTTTTTTSSRSTATTTTTTTTEPERLTAESTIDVRGIGPIEAGMTLREAERVGGHRLRVLELDTFGGDCYYAEPEGLAGISFMVVAPGDSAPSDPHDGIIGRVTADEPQWRTVSGAHVGSTIAEIRQRYPEHLRETPHEYREGGWYLTFEPQSEQDRHHGVRFEVADGTTVDLVHGGRADMIAAPEGCA